ncbi:MULTISPECIES: STAS domain-containing protein [unclassified Streptomyces]|uniref:STAS domain-containing protein n=1 Tax=unclassified Streptomyces TaxID=2593676 RepID=UPI001BE59C32|nr:STAS domain-containing protein [Streptomyces sp. ISL-21]MBT2611593.1 STAS domain-containing protein [Streptomyces sp. ISL-87]
MESFFEITVDRAGDTLTITFAGEIDFSAERALDAVLGSLPAGAAVVVDISGVTFMDLAGLRFLLALSSPHPQGVQAARRRRLAAPAPAFRSPRRRTRCGSRARAHRLRPGRRDPGDFGPGPHSPVSSAARRPPGACETTSRARPL